MSLKAKSYEREDLLKHLQPGDVILYSNNRLISWLIKIKTWSPISHTATYIGNGMSAESKWPRVDTYPTETKNVYAVLRPIVPFNFEAGLDWHVEEAIGQKYDLGGLFTSFFRPHGRGNIGKMWCSEHTARMAKKMGYFPFGDFDSEKVAPAYFLSSPLYAMIVRPLVVGEVPRTEDH